MNPQLFQRLILLWWVMTIVIGIVSTITQAYLPPELQTYVSAEGENVGTFDYLMLGLSVVISVVLIVASFGLYNFRPWARTLFLGANIFILLSGLLFGPTVLSEWAALFVYLDSILTGE